jgi:hypothetical protein
VASQVSDMNTACDRRCRPSHRADPQAQEGPHSGCQGTLGGQARARNTQPEVRSNDAREAVNARWAAEKSKREKVLQRLDSLKRSCRIREANPEPNRRHGLFPDHESPIQRLYGSPLALLA